MQYPDKPTEIRLADYLLGEMDGLEIHDFEARLASSPREQEELAEMKELFGLLSSSLEDEWQLNTVSVREERMFRCALGEQIDMPFDQEDDIAPVNEFAGFLRQSLADEWMTAEAGLISDEIAVTSQALGEATGGAPSADLEAVKSFAFKLEQAFSRELYDNDRVNFDEPLFTDYAVGELNYAEMEDYEHQLSESYLARKELSATKELVSLLSEGLEEEWKSMMAFEERHSVPEFSLVEASREDYSKEVPAVTPVVAEITGNNITKVNFSRVKESVRSLKSRQPILFGAAAVLSGLLVVGSVVGTLTKTSEVPSVAMIAPGNSWVDENDSASRDEVNLVSAPASSPNLMLMDELPEGFTLRAEKESLKYEDPYMGYSSKGLVPTSMTGQLSGDDAMGEWEGFVSPNEGDGAYSFHEGQIAGSDASFVMMSDRRKHQNGLQSIHLQGVLTLPEGQDVDLDSLTFSSGNGSKSFDKGMEEITAGLQSLVSDLEESGKITFPEVKSRIIQLLESHKELRNQAQSLR